MKKYVIALGGSSGSIYAKKLLDRLESISGVVFHGVMSDNAQINWGLELPRKSPADYNVKWYQQNDFYAPFASGSAKYDGMVICPCSMGLLGRIATGSSPDLMTRAADVFLKERRTLVIVPRESPYNLIHLRNMATLTEAGAIICPASPSFYSNPKTIDDLVLTVVDRVLDLLGIEVDTFRWQS